MLQSSSDQTHETKVREALDEAGLPRPAELHVQEDDYLPYSVTEVVWPDVQIRIDFDRGIYCLDVRASAGQPWIPFQKALRALGAPETGRCTEDLVALIRELSSVIGRLTPRLHDPTFAAEAAPALRPKQLR